MQYSIVISTFSVMGTPFHAVQMILTTRFRIGTAMPNRARRHSATLPRNHGAVAIPVHAWRHRDE
ncbi:MAG: hypothetical protein EBU40_00965 [Proteobacteria bacterium]|nr:hypothetical protein [Pseudomonadota bacterium]NCV01540.1 hypothetical protein [Pseudomonadota bacterium]HAH15301.1 hypothetical protein [Chloroflexota bacterium]